MMDRALRGDLPLSQYAIIGDGLTAALVARDGSVDWLCSWRFDAPAVFCRILDADRGGYFQVAPSIPCEARRGYVSGTNVLSTEFACASGTARLTDFMPLGGGTGPMLVRRLDGLSGTVTLRVDFVPTFDFARAATSIELCSDGCLASGNGQVLRLISSVPMKKTTSGRATSEVEVREGQTRWLFLTHGSPPLSDAAAESALRSTIDAWRRWSANGRYPGPYENHLRRSALVLKLLIHRPTGAMVAAPTTSLPEEPGGVRNWDYRYTWLRDASWLVSALMDLGYHEESMAFLDWLESLELGTGKPAVFYDLDGKPPGGETELDHLRGYRGSRPVRVGNAAADQDQHDVFGEVVSAVFMCSDAMPSMRPLRPGLWKMVSALANMAASHWEHADHGMWEVRDRPRHFVTSKLLCWTAIDRTLAIAHRDGLRGPVAEWTAERDRIRHAILSTGFDEEAGAFRRAAGDSEVDAASLLLPRYGFIPAEDARFVRSVEVIRRRLCSSGLLRRYLGADGLPGQEGAFAACSFWLADALARQGRLDEARATFEAVVAHANDVGLLSEEISLETGELLGNFPQAFTHLALIRAAITIAESESRVR